MSVVANRIKENERKTKMEFGKLLEIAEASGFETMSEQYAAIASGLFTLATAEQIETLARAFGVIKK